MRQEISPRKAIGRLLAAILTAAMFVPLAAAASPTPAPAAPSSDKLFMGYWAQWGSDQDPRTSLTANSNRVDYFSPYWYTLLADGTLRTRETGHAALTREVQAIGRKVLPLINKVKDNGVLMDSRLRAKSIDSIYKMLVNNGYDGVNIDFEGMPPSTRSGVTAFMRELWAKLKPAGIIVTMAVPAKWSPNDAINSFAACFDFEALGKVVDYMVIMTYDQHGAWSGPGPVAAADWVERVIKYSLTVVPKEKILLGLAGYGYNWSSRGTSVVKASAAPGLAARNGATIHWHNTHKVPYFTYYVSGVRHQVWYENSYSVDFKIDMINRYDLGGAALWALGQEDSRFWQVVAGTAGFSGGLGGSKGSATPPGAGTTPATGPGTGGGAGTAPGTGSFEDVGSSDWAYEAITNLAARGVVQGVDEARFEPDRDVTRAEFAVLLARVLNLPAPVETVFSFTDVSPSDWFYDYVRRVAAAGHMNGLGDGLFGPNRVLTRQEAAVIAARAGIDLPVPSGAQTPSYTDATSISGWAFAGVMEAARKGLLDGYPDGSFRPHRNLTRAEAAVVIGRLKP